VRDTAVLAGKRAWWEFDVESVGYVLRRFVEALTGDVRDVPLRRRLVVETMTRLAWVLDLWAAR
jgi:hypothetical protein